MKATKALIALARECEAVSAAQESLLDEAATCTDARQRAFLLEAAAQHEHHLSVLDQRAETLAALL